MYIVYLPGMLCTTNVKLTHYLQKAKRKLANILLLVACRVTENVTINLLKFQVIFRGCSEGSIVFTKSSKSIICRCSFRNDLIIELCSTRFNIYLCGRVQLLKKNLNLVLQLTSVLYFWIGNGVVFELNHNNELVYKSTTLVSPHHSIIYLNYRSLI